MPPKIITRSGLPIRHYAISAKTFYKNLPPEEQAANIEREAVIFRQTQAFPHERNAPMCNEFTEEAWKTFEKLSKTYYEIQGGMQSTMARFTPSAIACIEWILSCQQGREVNFLLDYTEEEQLAFIDSIFRTNLSFDKLSDDVDKIRMTCKEFSMVALDSFGGKFRTLTSITYKEVWQKTKLKTQTKLFVNAISPPHLSQSIALKLDQEMHTNIFEAFALIRIAAKNEVERLLGNDKAKSSIPAKDLPKPKASVDDNSPVFDIRANILKTGEDPCPNCILFGHNKRYVTHTLETCRSACSCGKEPPHLAAAKGVILCPHWKKTAMLLTVDDASDDEEDGDVAGGHFANMIRFYPSDDDDTCPDGIPH